MLKTEMQMSECLQCNKEANQRCLPLEGKQNRKLGTYEIYNTEVIFLVTDVYSISIFLQIKNYQAQQTWISL